MVIRTWERLIVRQIVRLSVRLRVRLRRVHKAFHIDCQGWNATHFCSSLFNL